MENKIPLLVIAGPTASGKTACAVELAKIYDGEIVSADSMQIYKGLSIATAKPTKEEMQGVPHYLIDFLEPEQAFSVADYVKLAGERIREIHSRGKVPILCGGTGLYISSLVNNVIFDDTETDGLVRKRLEEEAKTLGGHALWERLREVDPETAEKVHENNLPRVIRGLEVFETTGIPLSQHKVNSRREQSPYNACIIGLTASDRQYLYDRINRRVDVMVENGLIEECRAFYDSFTPATAYQAIGYKELRPYIDGDVSLNEAVENLKRATRRYAKRQLTWFRRNERINWLYIDKYQKREDMLKDAFTLVESFMKGEKAG